MFRSKKLHKRVAVALRYIFGKPLKEKRLAFTSNLKIKDIPKGKWVFVSSNVVINEVEDWWLEDVRIVCEDSEGPCVEERKMFCGSMIK